MLHPHLITDPHLITKLYHGSRQAAEAMESIIDFGSLDLESYTSSQSRDISEDGMLLPKMMLTYESNTKLNLKHYRFGERI